MRLRIIFNVLNDGVRPNKMSKKFLKILRLCVKITTIMSKQGTLICSMDDGMKEFLN